MSFLFFSIDFLHRKYLSLHIVIIIYKLCNVFAIWLYRWNLNFPTRDGLIVSPTCRNEDEVRSIFKINNYKINIYIPFLSIFPGKTKAKLHPQHLVLSASCRIFGMHLHQKSPELSWATATRFVSTISNVYMGIYLYSGYIAHLLKRATRIPISKRNTNISC